MSNKVLLYTEFSSWLCSLPANNACGRANSTTACPVSRWLNVTKPGKWTVLSDMAICTKENYVNYRLDSVLVKFVAAVDAHGNSLPEKYNGNWLSVIECVRILSAIIGKELGAFGYA